MRKETLMARDYVEIHFNVPRALDKRFKEALAKSEFSTQSEFLRFCMMRLVSRFERKDAVGRKPSQGAQELSGLQSEGSV